MNRMTRALVLAGSLTSVLLLGPVGKEFGDWLVRAFAADDQGAANKCACVDQAGHPTSCPPPATTAGDSAGGIDPNGKPGG